VTKVITHACQNQKIKMHKLAVTYYCSNLLMSTLDTQLYQSCAAKSKVTWICRYH